MVTIRQYPIISFAPSPAIPNAGKAQNGCAIFVHASPQVIANADFAAETPIICPAGITIGACTTHCPPPEGTKKFTIPALKKVNNGNVLGVEILTKKLDIKPAKEFPSMSIPTIIPMIPA